MSLKDLLKLLLLIPFISSPSFAQPIAIKCTDFEGYSYYFKQEQNKDREFVDDKSEGLQLVLLVNDDNQALLSYVAPLQSKEIRTNEMDGNLLQVTTSTPTQDSFRIQVVETPGENSINKEPGVTVFYLFNMLPGGKGDVIKTTYRLNSNVPKASVEKGACTLGSGQ